MARIVASAENFAFGPAGKLVTVAERLAERSHRLVFVGYGTALELAGRSGHWDAVIPCDTEGPEFTATAAPLLRDADLLLTCVDRPSAQLALDLGTPVAWLDPLAWWWEDEFPAWIDAVDLRISQVSIGGREAVNARSTHSGHVTVGPIVASGPPRDPDGGTLLVNFGGGEAAGWYRPGEDGEHPYLIVDLLQSAVDLSGFDAVLVAGGERIIAECRRRWPHSPFAFACLEHREFMARLASARAFLTVPGLEAPLEAWTMGVPTLFLPPSNSSQYVQLDEYRANGSAAASVHLRDFMAPLDFTGLSLRERSAAFFTQLGEAERHRDRLARDIEAMLDPGPWPTLVEAGTAYVNALGANGLDHSVDAIEALLRTERTTP